MKPISLAVSSCPNDTFSFYSFIHNPPEGISLDVEYLDIEQLNLGILAGKWDIVKASIPVALKCERQYRLMQSGAALGFGVGPVCVFLPAAASDDPQSPDPKEVLNKKMNEKVTLRVALPGENTMANFLWNYYLENIPVLSSLKVEKVFLHFAEILEKVQRNEVDLGVVIHEGRFVYEGMGLSLYEDLGEFWQKKTNLPVPLGGIFIRQDMDSAIAAKMEKHLEESVRSALDHRKIHDSVYIEKILPFMQQHARELDPQVIEKHIDYYVNDETVHLTQKGNSAIEKTWDMMKRQNRI